MHYFKRNIGDYHKKAGRLTMLQHGAYTLLIDACYDRERFPTMDDAIDWCWASTEAEIEAVKFVLSKFFTATDSGEYVQNRIQEEIDNYHKTSETNRRIAIERETKRREKSTKRAQGVNEAPPNQEPLTNNHKPLTKEPTKARPKDAAQVEEYAKSIQFRIEGQKFIDHYEANGWMRGKNRIKDWKACVRTWKSNQADNQPAQPQNKYRDLN